jgi:hypothetical protein
MVHASRGQQLLEGCVIFWHDQNGCRLAILGDERGFVFGLAVQFKVIFVDPT